MNGLLIVNKEKNMTSRDVVNIICKKFNTKKVGHSGTLDPIATGVLVVAIGRYTKLINILTSSYKEYIATLKLGIETDTLDITGNIINEKKYYVDKAKVINILNSFLGKSIQEVPKYSAVKVNGKKLYEYARDNIEIDLPKRKIDIKEIELLEYKDDIIKFRCIVSKGTYIRSLIKDIGLKMETYATMIDLCRTKQGDFSIDNSYTLSDISNDNYKILTYEDIFKTYEKYELNEEEYFKVKNGAKMPIAFNNDEVIYTYNNKYIALYKKDNGVAKVKIMLDNS